MGRETWTAVQEAQRPTQDKPKEEYAKTHIKFSKTKDKEKILKATREKQQVTYKEIFI